MANITLNIEGDLNIYVSEEDGDIVSLDEEDKKLITQVLEDGTAELTNGAEIRCAFGL